jgi:hypothetical protein
VTQRMGWMPSVATIAVGSFAICVEPLRAFAETIIITCATENPTAGRDSGSLTATYTGDATGTLTVKASLFEFSVPAQRIEQADLPAPVIQAYAKTTAVMPDLATLEACIKKILDPADVDDNRAYDRAVMACAKDLQPGTAPMPITAAVNISLLPGKSPGIMAPIVEVYRYYAGKSARPGGPTRLETFPDGCKRVAE